MRTKSILTTFLILGNSLVSGELPTSDSAPKFIPGTNKPIVVGIPVRQNGNVTIIENETKPNNPPSNAVDELTNNPFVDYKTEYEKLLLLNKQLDSNLTSLKQSLITSNDTGLSLQAKLDSVTTELETITDERNKFFKALNDANNQTSQLRTENSNLLLQVNQLTELSQHLGTPFDGWIYSPDLGWCFVSPSTMPYFYMNDRGWVFYETGSNPRRMYFYDSETWEQHE